MKAGLAKIFSGCAGAFRATAGRVAAVSLMVMTLANCAAFTDPNGFWGKASPFSDQTPWADYALAAIARNDLQAAEAYTDRALVRNPKDPYALLAAGVIFQNTGRPFRAKQMYQEVMALNPALAANIQSWSRLSPGGLADIAASNLQVLDMVGAAGAGAELSPQGAPMGGASGAGFDTGLPGAMPPTPGSSAVSSWATPPLSGAPHAIQASPMPAPTEEPAIGLTASDQNAINRFKVLGRLLGEGLITDEEFQARRNANVGALTPLTAAPPSAGLDRPVPPAEQLIQRLAALRRALEMRAISAREHSVERTMILDALLPAQPLSQAGPAAPPEGIMDAAAAVRRLETLRNAKLINSDEMARERSAVEKGLGLGRGGAPLPSQKSSAGRSSAPQSMVSPDNPFAAAKQNGSGPRMLVPSDGAAEALIAPKKDMSLLSGFDGGGGGGGSGIHLASYQSQRSAEASAAEFSRRFSSALSGLGHTVKKADVPGKGTYYRLVFGPVGSNAEATSLCKKIKSQGQYCSPASM